MTRCHKLSGSALVVYLAQDPAGTNAINDICIGNYWIAEFLGSVVFQGSLMGHQVQSNKH